MKIVQKHSTKSQSDTLHRVLALFPGVRLSERGGRGGCPVRNHRSRYPVSITAGDTGVLLKCWPGCPTESILQAIGLEFSDLFYEPARRSGVNTKTRGEQPLFPYRWNWRKPVHELQAIAECRRVFAEDFLESLKALDGHELSDAQIDELWPSIALARTWVRTSENLFDLVYEITETMRWKEGRDHV